MTELEDLSLETEIPSDDASREIAEAVGARHSIARKYVRRLRRRHPDATPADLIRMLERRYTTAITTAGAMVSAGAIAIDVGIAMIPVAGAAAAGAKSASQQAAKKAATEAVKVTAKQAGKQAAKGVALSAATTGARRVAMLLPAGDQQLQFEITALFALAVADIHGMELDRDQAHALVYGLSNDRVSQQQIATMAADVAGEPSGVVGVSRKIAAGRDDWSHWAHTLADSLPSGEAQSLVRTIQTGQLDTVRDGLTRRQQTTIEYGIGAVTGGVARFAFGREVVDAARLAFADPPGEFPPHLALTVKEKPEPEDREPNRALAAMEEAARTTGSRITSTAKAVGGGVAAGAEAAGSGVATATAAVTRPFRSVDIDGDGIPDEPQALTAVKRAGGTAAGAISGVAGLFRGKDDGEGRARPAMRRMVGRRGSASGHVEDVDEPSEFVEDSDGAPHVDELGAAAE